MTKKVDGADGISSQWKHPVSVHAADGWLEIRSVVDLLGTERRDELTTKNLREIEGHLPTTILAQRALAVTSSASAAVVPRGRRDGLRSSAVLTARCARRSRVRTL